MAIQEITGTDTWGNIKGKINANFSELGQNSESTAKGQLLANSVDLIDFYAGQGDNPTSKAVRRGRNGQIILAYLYPNGRATEYSFAPDYDGLFFLKGIDVGKVATETVVTKKFTPVALGANIAVFSGSTYSTTVVGSKFTGSFEGTGFLFFTAKSLSGGLWKFTINGDGVSEVRNVSLYYVGGASGVLMTTYIEVISGLPRGAYTFEAEFMGADPGKTSGTARGWLQYSATSNITVEGMDTVVRLQSQTHLISPTLSGNYTWTSDIRGYATTAGTTFTFTFTGTEFRFFYYRNNQGGLWRFTVDGGTTYDLSTYAASAADTSAVIATGLANTAHTVVAEFMGADPANPVTTPRGWLKYSRYSPGTIEISPRPIDQTEGMLQPDAITEWAIQAIPISRVGQWGYSWHPAHGNDRGVSRAISGTFTIDGVEYGIGDLSLIDTSYTPITSFRFKEQYTAYNVLDIAGALPLWIGELDYSTREDGQIQQAHRLTFQNDLTFQTGYMLMLGASDYADRFGNATLEEYSKAQLTGGTFDYTLSSGAYARISASDYIAVAHSVTPRQTFQIQSPVNKRLFTNHVETYIKAYFTSFVDGNTVSAGTSILSSVQFLGKAI